MSEHMLKAESEEDPERAQDDDTGDNSTDISEPHLAGSDEHYLPVDPRSVCLGTHMRSFFGAEHCINISRFLHHVPVNTYKQDALCSLD